MDKERKHCQQKLDPEMTATKEKKSEYVEYHRHRYHRHRSHMYSNSSPPRGIISNDDVTPSSTPVQTSEKVSQSTLKARAIMAANNNSAGNSTNKSNLSNPHAGVAKKPVCGVINFEQTSQGVHITGYIKGLGKETSHGFHIHEFGDVSSCCTAIGDHFNPFKRAHGGLKDAERHLGDLGNVTAGVCGTACIDILDPMISLQGEHSIVGRSIVVDAMPDDINHGRNKDSTKMDNSSARLGCGIIALVNPQAP